MHLIESLLMESEAPPLSIQGRSLPSQCLLEDDQGNRLGLVFDLTEIRADVWFRLHSGGARYLVAPNVDGWRAITVQMFMENYQEHALTKTYRLTGHWIEFDHFPTFMEVLKWKRPQMSGFVHLHAHSEFSALDGYATISEMVEAAVADGQPALAVTDHGVCAGHPHLQAEAKKHGIKPIFGIEANLVEDRFRKGEDGQDKRQVLYDYNHLILWAWDDAGLRNLWAMNTEAYREGFYGRPRMDWDTLARHSDGVIASTACLRGPLARSILEGEDDLTMSILGRLMNIFPRLYIELQTNSAPEQFVLNQGLVQLARAHHLPLIVTADSHYAKASDQVAHKAWIASQTNRDLKDEEDLFAGSMSYHMATEAEVRAALEGLGQVVIDDAIANTMHIADSIDASLGGKATPPVFSKGENPVARDADRLMKICFDNWWKVADKDMDTYVARFEREMRLLIDRQYCGYFLMVADYCQWARDRGILLGPGRGSGSGSLVAFLSGITGIDPIEAGLMFERFLTEGRVALPDFDVDFPSSKRQELTDYIIEKYGRENVVRVGTHIRMKNKGVIRGLARILKNSINIHYPDIDAMSKIVDAAEADKAGLGMSWDDLWAESGEELEPYKVKYPLIFEYAEQMVGRLRTYGKHPAGLVIAPEAHLTERLPMRKAGDDLVVEFDMDALESIGLVKFDLLTLRTLDTIQKTVDLVESQMGVRLDIARWKDEYADSSVWAEIADGHTLGIFQIETPGGTRDTKRLRPTNLDELSDLITLVRPGPKRSGLTETYMRRKFGEEGVSVLDPRLEPILAKTFGCMIYQEQVISTFMALAGYNSTEADDIRKLLGKKQVERTTEAGREFLERAVANGTNEQIAQIIWLQIQEFARYSFNRSHAYAYAMLGYWTAWLKFKYPVQFLAACMSTVDKGRIPEFINEARRMGFSVLPPDINLSGRGFFAGEHEIRYGLDGVKGIGDRAVDAVIQGQPYGSFTDFMERKGQQANMGVVKTLASVGAFDSLVGHRRALEDYVEWMTDGSAEVCRSYDDTAVKPHGLPCQFDWDSEPVVIGKRGLPLKQKPLPKRCTKACRNYNPPERHLTADEVMGIPRYSEEEIMDRELELLGIHLTATPFDRIPDQLWEEELAPGQMLKRGTEVEAGDNRTYVTPGTVLRVRPHTSARDGKLMGFAAFYAVDAELDVVIFSENWEKYQDDLRIGNLCFLFLRKTERGLQLISLQVA